MTDTLASVRQPVNTANGLPNEHYIDPKTYDEERRAVLFATWAALAVAADVRKTGMRCQLILLACLFCCCAIAMDRSVFSKTHVATVV